MEFETKDISFNNLKREARIAYSETQIYDLIIIGGGITGVGIALDASLRGLRTLLVEKKDFASGTSSKSTKLIHGGLRYLKQLELGLVKETGLERAVAHNNIPHLVHPEKMLLPIVNKGTFGKFSAMLAITVYDKLAKVPEKDRKKSFSKKETQELEPLLNSQILKSSIQYSEYRTDDARLTIELIKAAIREGAEAFNYMEVEEFIYENNIVKGIICIDRVAQIKREFKGAQVVSAAGPWVDVLRTTNRSKVGKSLQLTKGVHIVLPREKLPLESSVYFDAFDGRMLFAIPRANVTYVGTSDTNYQGNKDKICCTLEDANYILKATNNMFGIKKLEVEDIISSWAGLRPLIHEDGKSPSELSRKDEIFISESKLISIAGGKLTGFRKMAERIVNLVIESNKNLEPKGCQTKFYKIHSDSFQDYNEFETYLEQIKKEYDDILHSKYDAWYFVTTYGKNAKTILNSARSNSEEGIKSLLSAEIEYCIQYESCYAPDDYFNRRSGRIYFEIDSVKSNLDFIIDIFSKRFAWKIEQIVEMKNLALSYLEEVEAIQ